MSTTYRLPTPPPWVLWLLVAIALVCAIAKSGAQTVTITPVMAVYDVGQVAQAKQIATARNKANLPALQVLLNVDSGPGTEADRKLFLTGWPVGVMRIGYVDLDDDDGNLRAVAAIRADVLTWRGAGVPLIFLDDCHAWDVPKQAEKLRQTVWDVIAGTGYETRHVTLNPGGPVTKASAWMRAKSYTVCDFEDPLAKLKPASVGQMWLSFVADRASAEALIAKARAQRTVRMVGFDQLKFWKVRDKEWQVPLPPDLEALLSTLK